MTYATYNYYTSTYGGTAISESEFTTVANKASAYIDYFTMNRASSYTDTNEYLASACCAVADIVYDASTSSTPSGVATETVGSHNVSYRSEEERISGLMSQIRNALYIYLANTGLLYRGMPVCTHRTI